MKFYVICAVVLCAPSVFGFINVVVLDDYLHNQEADCARVSGASDLNIELARQTRRIPDNQQMNEFSKCMLEKFNVMYPDGSINPDVTTYRVTDDTNYIHRVSERCKTHGGRDAGDTARNIMSCYLDAGQFVLATTPRVRT